MQIGSKYANSTLKDASDELMEMYKHLEENRKIETSEFELFLFQLRICSLNIHVSVINHGYLDIVPICDALDRVIAESSMKQGC